MADNSPIQVQMPDGRIAQFPAGTDPAVIRAAIRRYMAVNPAAPNPSASSQTMSRDTAGEAATPPALAATAPGLTATSPRGQPSSTPLEDTFVGRAVRSVGVNRLDPAVEMLMRASNAFGGTPTDALKDFQAGAARRRAEYEASRARAGDTGADIAGTLGTGVTDALLLKPFLPMPTSLADLAATGAKAGAVTGVLNPVENTEDRSNAQFFTDKLKQAGVGAGTGALLSPAVAYGMQRLIGMGMGAGSSLAKYIRNRVAPSSAYTVANDPQALEQYLATQARQTGADWTQIPDALKQSLREATKRAISTTDALPDEAIRNRLIAEKENLPQLTLGQATRDPVQFSREANSPDEELRMLFGDQRNAATQRMQQIAGGAGAPATKYDVGAQIRDAIAAQAKMHNDRVNGLYEAARSDPSGYANITNTSDFVHNALGELENKMLSPSLPPGVLKKLQDLASEGGMLSARDAVQMRQAINGLMSNDRSPTNAALRVVKTELDKLLDNPQFAEDDAGKPVIQLFKAASAARRKQGEWEGSSAVIGDLASRDPKMAVEKIVDRYVTGAGPVDDFTGLWKTLPPPVQQGIKRQFVDHVISLGTNGTGTTATGGSQAIKYLRNYPPEKLNLMFHPDELRSLRNVLEYLRLTSEAPAGSFVNRSNSLVDLKDLLSRSGNLPIAGEQVMRPLRAMAAEHAARRAMGPGVHVPQEYRLGALGQAIARQLPYMALPGAQLGAQAAPGAPPEDQ